MAVVGRDFILPTAIFLWQPPPPSFPMLSEKSGLKIKLGGSDQEEGRNCDRNKPLPYELLFSQWVLKAALDLQRVEK